MNTRGIFNIELIISLMILLIILASFLSISFKEFSSIDETQNRKESRIIANDIRDVITKVYLNGEGYSIKYELPSKINKETYILKVNDTGVYVNSHYQLTYSKLPQNILNHKEWFLESGNIYEFINKNNTVNIIKYN